LSYYFMICEKEFELLHTFEAEEEDDEVDWRKQV
jgi:hypothetical protein